MASRRILVPMAVLASVFAWAEFVHWRASRSLLGEGHAAPESEAVVVLGFCNRGARANYVNRFRVRAGIRSIDPRASRSVLVLCGGAVAGSTPEAQLMKRFAREEFGYTGAIRTDDDSRTTWENIRNAIPLIEGADSIKVVSNSPHAAIGRAYLWEQRPDLGPLLRRGQDYRFGEVLFLKPVAAVIALGKEPRRRPSTSPGGRSVVG